MAETLLSEWPTIAERELGRAVDEIRANMAAAGVNASGRTSRAIRYEVRDNGGAIIAPHYLPQLEQGIPPLGSGTPHGLYDAIKQWIVDKGLYVDDRQQRSFAYLITRNLHERGAWPWRNGGRQQPPLSDIYTDTLRGVRTGGGLLHRIGSALGGAIKRGILRLFRGR